MGQKCVFALLPHNILGVDFFSILWHNQKDGAIFAVKISKGTNAVVIKTRMTAVLSAILLLLSAVLCSASPVFAAESITDASEAKGSDYTDCDLLARALDDIFAGDVDLYSNSSCTREKNAPLGSRPMTGSAMYWVKSPVTGEHISGWQCYIYANAVYNKLFGEWIRHGDEEYVYSEVVIEGGAREVSYEMFAEAGVRCGAYMRTTSYSDGSYNSTYAHSLILLAYDAETVTYLDGNSDGNGLIRINVRTWDDFNDTNLSGRRRFVNHIIQPTEEAFDKLYGSSGPSLPSVLDPAQLKGGDVSGNGQVDARDYLLLKRYVLGSLDFAAWQAIVADVSCDGNVDARDYLLIKSHVLGKYTLS